mmetsp:Transcript_39168/g.103377  ORF Transcript_39168/g.103377 Transcript_39168/m.103377 type:complete len:736 (+) Transcript_39168:106-2313(+)
MSGHVSSLIKQKGFVFWLMGLTVVYQIISQVLMYRALRAQRHDDDPRLAPGGAFAAASAQGGESCGASAANASKSAAGGGPTARRCLEAQLFRTWQQAAAVDLFRSPAASSSAANGLGLGGLGRAVEDMVPMESDASNLSTAPVAPPAATVEDQDNVSGAVPAAASGGEEGEEDQSWSPMTAWAQGLADLQRSLEQRMGSRPSRRRQYEGELSQQLEHHARSIATSLEGEETTGWGHELGQLQKTLEAKQAALPSQRRQHAQNAASEARPANGTRREGPLMNQIYDLQREMCEDPGRKNHPVCMNLTRNTADKTRPMASNTSIDLRQHAATLSVDLAAIAAESAEWHHEFQQKVDRDHKELCEHPERRHRPDCAKFLASVEELERRGNKAYQLARTASKAALRANIASEAKERALALDAKLARIKAERKVWERELLEKYDRPRDGTRQGLADASTAAPSQVDSPQAPDSFLPARHHGPELHWSSVVRWSAGRNLRGTAGSQVHAQVGRAELRAAHWAGMIPKVACIAAVESGPALEIQMKYFIDNFHLQSYEGPTQLVFVYHHKDRAAARLVQSHADGFHVKGVAAFGEGKFPSTAALRFGAWSSDADVIAHWNFNEFQHPQRLSLQVRALAFSSRPACILKGLREDGAGADEATLLGEASWMEQHWHPLLKEQEDVLEVAQARHVVEMDMGLATGSGGGGRHGGRGTPAAESLASLRASMDESFEQLVNLLKED